MPVPSTIPFAHEVRFAEQEKETEAIDNLITKKHEVVHSYGWYMRKYIRDTKAMGGIPIVCSLVARNNFENGKVVRATESYALWAMEIAKEEKLPTSI